MHGLNIREQAYALLHRQLCCCWPLVANNYPKPELPRVSAPAAYTYQAPPPPIISTAPLQWLQTLMPPPIATSTQQGESPDLFFRTQQCADGCAFCNQKGHCIWECSLTEEYVCTGYANISNGCIHLPNLQPVPNDGSGHGVKAAIDAWFAVHMPPPPAPSVVAQPPACDSPPHSMLTYTASHFEEITDMYILQVAAVSSPELLTNADAHTPTHVNLSNSDNSNSEPNIFKVFAAEKKRCSGKAPCLPEAVQRKSAPNKPAPQDKPPMLAPQVDSPKPAPLTKPVLQVDSAKPSLQYHYHSDPEDLHLLSELHSWFWQGKLDQITPAHLCAASPSIRKDIADQHRVWWVETASYETACTSDPSFAKPHSLPNPSLTDSPEPVYSLPLQEVDIALSSGITEPSLLDQGSQIVIIRQDLAQEINTQINPTLRIQMEGANSTTNWTLGCAENLPMQVGNIPFHLHAHIIECAPFCLLLGCPFQHQLLCCLDSLPNGIRVLALATTRHSSTPFSSAV